MKFWNCAPRFQMGSVEIHWACSRHRCFSNPVERIDRMRSCNLSPDSCRSLRNGEVCDFDDKDALSHKLPAKFSGDFCVTQHHGNDGSIDARRGAMLGSCV